MGSPEPSRRGARSRGVAEKVARSAGEPGPENRLEVTNDASSVGFFQSFPSPGRSRGGFPLPYWEKSSRGSVPLVPARRYENRADGAQSGRVWPGRRTVPGRGRPQGRPPLTPGSPLARFPPPSEGGRTGHRRDTRAGGYPRERLRLGQGSASSPCGGATEVPPSQRSSLASPPSPPLKNPPEGLSNSSQTECMEPCGR